MGAFSPGCGRDAVIQYLLGKRCLASSGTEIKLELLRYRLSCHVITDKSPVWSPVLLSSNFNILWHSKQAVIIDFPQVIEFDNNPNADAFLERDVRSLCKSFGKQGVKADEEKVLREVRYF